MSLLARRIGAMPVRSASEAWHKIIAILAPDEGSEAHKQLAACTGILSCIIADEVPNEAAIVVSGSGPRVRFYCLYGDAAVAGEELNEQELPFDATSGDWRLSAPCTAEDLPWIAAALSRVSTRVTARDASEKEPESQADREQSSETDIAVDKDSFLKP